MLKITPDSDSLGSAIDMLHAMETSEERDSRDQRQIFWLSILVFAQHFMRFFTVGLIAIAAVFFWLNVGRG